MLGWALTFFMIAILAALLGFTGIAVAAAGVLFNVVAFLCLERLGLALTVPLAYGIDIAYVVLVARLSRPRPSERTLPAPVAGG